MTEPATSETWLPVPGFPGYEVSDLGRVRSFRLYRGSTAPRLLKPALSRGYPKVVLRRDSDGKRLNRLVPHLVMLAFVGPRPAGMEIRHGPAGKLDNRLSSLCYGTRSENLADRWRDGWHGRDLRGAKNPRAKITPGVAKQIRERVAAGESHGAVARNLGVGRSTVGRVVHGDHWTAAQVAP